MIVNYHISSLICIVQANIRNTTYEINDKNRDAYFAKVMKNEASIVVVLKEIKTKNKEEEQLDKNNTKIEEIVV